MLGVQQTNAQLRRASLISEIYSETAGPTGGNIQAAAAVGEGASGGTVPGQPGTVKPPAPGAPGAPGAAGAPGAPGSALQAAGISDLKGHPAFRAKRIRKTGLSKLGKRCVKS